MSSSEIVIRDNNVAKFDRILKINNTFEQSAAISQLPMDERLKFYNYREMQKKMNTGKSNINFKKFNKLYVMRTEDNEKFQKQYNALTEEEKSAFNQYKSMIEIADKEAKDSDFMEGTSITTRRKKTIDEVFKNLEESEKTPAKKDISQAFAGREKAEKENIDRRKKITEQLKKEREQIVIKSKQDIELDKMIDDAFNEMTLARYTVQKEVVKNEKKYVGDKFVETEWDIPSLSPSESRLPKSDQNRILRSRELMTTFTEGITEGDEVEVRFGQQKGKFFDSQVSQDAFNNVFEWASKKANIVPESSTIYIKSVKTEAGWESIRIIDNKRIEKKVQIKNITSQNWGFRISRSTETQMPASEIQKYDLKTFAIRQRVRWSVGIPQGKLDMTKVIDPKKRNIPRYEVEIELGKGMLDGDFNKNLEALVKFFYPIMQNSEKIVSPLNVSILKKNYNSIFYESTQAQIQPEIFYEMGADEDLVEKIEKEDPYNFYNVENKPRAFNFKNIASGYDYRVTAKLDGLRARLFIDVNGVFSINTKTGFVKAIYLGPWQDNSLDGTVIDAELYNNEYYPFDVLAWKGKNVINLYFDQRIGKLTSIVDGQQVGPSIPHINYGKPFFGAPRAQIYNTIQNAFIWQEKNKDLKFDGLIFQRNDEPYWEPAGDKKNAKVTSTMKWKPTDEISVDLLTRINSENKQVQFYSTGERGLEEEVFFDTIGTYDQYNIPFDLVDVKDFIAEYQFIGEAPYIQFKIQRKDKTEPNFHTVVKSNKDSFFKDPTTKEDLTGGTLKPWRKWASALKRDLINGLIDPIRKTQLGTESKEFYVPWARVLDIGVGRGGGALKELAKNSRMVYGIDPDSENLKNLSSRLEGTYFSDSEKKRISIAKMGGEDTEEILGLIGEEKVDLITMFFSLSFFFESDDKLSRLLETIDKTAKKNSILAVQFMDGEKIFSDFKGRKVGKTYNISAGDNSPYIIKFRLPEEMGIGIPLTISFPNEKDTIIGVGEEKGTQNEWFVDERIFTNRLKGLGFVKLTDDFMDKDSILPTSNVGFAELNRSIVYFRGKGIVVPDLKLQKTYFNEEDNEEYMGPLSENIQEEWKEFNRIGSRGDKDSLLASVLFHISKSYRMKDGDKTYRDAKIKQLRKQLANLIDEEMFQLLVSGNVAHNMTYDLLYTKAYDTMVDNKKVDVVYDEKTAPKVAYMKYVERIKNGYIGLEIVEAIGCLWDVRINVYDESGKVVFVGNKDGKKKTFDILKIGDIAFEPLLPK